MFLNSKGNSYCFDERRLFGELVNKKLTDGSLNQHTGGSKWDTKEVLPVLNESYHLRVRLPQDALPVHFHKPIPCRTHVVVLNTHLFVDVSTDLLQHAKVFRGAKMDGNISTFSLFMSEVRVGQSVNRLHKCQKPMHDGM